MKLSEEVKLGLSTILDESVEGDSTIPGATAVVISKDGSELFVKSAGTRGVSTSDPVTPDDIYWLASCTKMVAGLACMQLVEKGVLELDNSAQTEGLCPEWRHLKVLTPDGTLVDRTNGITLRMLLTHTAGFGYSFSSPRLRDYGYPVGFDEFSGYWRDLMQPLLFQPGEAWEYGISLDWAGLVLERATGMSLNDYIQAKICSPLGLENLTMFPSENMKSRIVHLTQRTPDGRLHDRDHLHRRPLIISTDEQKKGTVNSAGAGLFGKPQDYARIIAVLLNDGTCPLTGVKLLEKSTVDLMFTNQIPQFPQFGRQGIHAAKPELMTFVPDLYPTPGNTPQGYGLTFMLSGGQTGRSEGTAWWAGVANTFWWADRENGVGGLVCAQILPFGDPNVLGLWFQLEAGVYQGLETATT